MPTIVHKAEAYLTLIESVVREAGADPVRLSEAELREYAPRPVVGGVRFRSRFPDGVDREFAVLAQRGASLRAPLIALCHPQPPFLAWPHVEKDGVLCLPGEGATIAIDNPKGVIENHLGQAAKLIEDCAAGHLEADFLREANSYWNQAKSADGPACLSLLELQGPSREIAIWRTNSHIYCAENEHDVRSWVRNVLSEPDKTVEVDRGVLLWLNTPLHPREFPKCAADMYELARRKAPAAVPILDNLAGRPGVDTLAMVVAAPTPTGPFCGGILVSAPRTAARYGRVKQPLSKGFRPGHVPPQIAVSRFFAGTPVNRATVERIDALWVHGRTHDKGAAELRGKAVAILGCGSVGANVAVLLAQAGVGNLVLVDPDTLSSANICRHPLGARHVSRFKADALAEDLKRRLPHTEIVALSKKWEQLDTDSFRKVEAADLVVSAIGHAGSELTLNAALREVGVPVLYGWLEPYAAAAHAVLIGTSGPCFRCCLDDKCIPVLRATEWPADSELRQEPACGSVFQPYGSVDTQNGAALAAQLALDVLLKQRGEPQHRVRVVEKHRITALGGKWSERWLDATKREEGGFTWTTSDEVRKSCTERH